MTITSKFSSKTISLLTYTKPLRPHNSNVINNIARRMLSRYKQDTSVADSSTRRCSLHLQDTSPQYNTQLPMMPALSESCYAAPRSVEGPKQSRKQKQVGQHFLEEDATSNRGRGSQWTRTSRTRASNSYGKPNTIRSWTSRSARI